MRIFIFMATALCLSSLTGFQKKGCSNVISWEGMVSIKGYGNIDPEQNGSGYIQGDTGLLSDLFGDLAFMPEAMPEGAARYATVTFRDGLTIKLTMTTARPLAFMVSRYRYGCSSPKLGENGWYEATRPLSWEESHEIKRLQAYRG